MTLNDLGYIAKLCNHITVVAGMLKENPDICTGFKPNQNRINFKFRSSDNTNPYKPCLLYTSDAADEAADE